MNKKIYLSPPDMSQYEKKLLVNAFDSNWIAPLGPEVDKFEKEIASYLNIDFAAALNSGTAALHMALKVSGVKEGDIVLCPSLTFAATANVVMFEKAVPVFIDSNVDTWVMDIEALEKALKKYKPKAIITVDLYGNSCDYDSIDYLAKKYDAIIIEDSAESLGSEYKNKKCGTFGSIGILSFNGNKIITTSGGGMLVSTNEDYVKKARYLSSQAREPVLHYEHQEIGYNYRLSNLLAAIGRAQLSRLDTFVSIRNKIFNKYYNSLSQLEGFNFIKEPRYCSSNRWLTTLTVKESILSRDSIIFELEKEGIESRPVWKPMHLQPVFKGFDYVCNGGKDVSGKTFRYGICLPSGSSLKLNQQDKIIDIITNTYHKALKS